MEIYRGREDSANESKREGRKEESESGEVEFNRG